MFDLSAKRCDSVNRYIVPSKTQITIHDGNPPRAEQPRYGSVPTRTVALLPTSCANRRVDADTKRFPDGALSPR